MRQTLLWLDLETTGLDPHVDRPLQIAGFLTDSDLKQIAPAFDYVVGYEQTDIDDMRTSCDPFVVRMHEATGLWDRLGAGRNLSDIGVELCFYLDRYAGEKPMPAGSSLSGVDVPFLREFWPEVAGRLHYRVLDVTSVAFAARSFGWVVGEYPKKRTHNAVDDVRESLAELQWVRDAHA